VRPAVTALALVALLVAPSAVLAQTGTPTPPSGGSPFGPLPPAQQTPPPTQTAPTPTPRTPASSSSESGPSTLGIFGLFAAGVLVIVLIGWLILRDARRSLPERARRRGRKRKAKAASPPASGKRPPPRPPKKQHASRARGNQRRSKRRAR
jgi:hypothetical protein